MNDKDIIKALGCCSEAVCGRCPLRVENMCESKVTGHALDLIKRQQAEIERLDLDLITMRGSANSYKLHYEKARVEATKEFADRWHEKHQLATSLVSAVGKIPDVVTKAFGLDSKITDAVLKEMLGEVDGK